MNKPTEEKIRCPECGLEQTFRAWRRIDIARDPALKEKLLSRELVAFKCQRCEHEAELAHDLLYHDAKKKLMIRLVHDGNPMAAIQKEKAFPEPPDRNYTLRVVTSMDRLIEKIRIFDDGHNDKAIELMKMEISAQEKNTQLQEVFYSASQKIMTRETVIKLVGITEGGEIRYTFPWDPKDDRIAGVLNLITKGNRINEGEWLLVDQEYALMAIARARTRR